MTAARMTEPVLIIEDDRNTASLPNELPPAELARWSEKFQEETRKWVAELEAKGLAAKDAVVMYNKISEEQGIQCAAFPAEWH